MICAVSPRVWKPTDELGRQKRSARYRREAAEAIETLTAGLQRVSDQMELAKATPQLVTNRQ